MSGPDGTGATRLVRPRWIWIAAALLLGQMLAGMLIAASRDAPTYDEPAYIGSGLAYWHLHQLKWTPEQPPLTKLISTFPLLFTHINIPADATQGADAYALGDAILYRGGNDPQHIVWLARLPMIFLTLCFALVVFGFAAELFGARAGLLALALVSLYPPVLAHGHLATTDVGIAGFSLLAFWLLWRARTRSSWWLAAAGVAFGLALASKDNALLFVPVVFGLAVWSEIRKEKQRDTASRKRWVLAVARAAGTLAISVAVVWVIYLIVDTHLTLDVPVFGEDKVHGLVKAIINALPFPAAFRAGVKFQIAAEREVARSFLFGQLRLSGRPDYYPAVLLIKTPLGVLLIWLIGLAALVRDRARRAAAVYLLLPPLVILLASLGSGRDIGVRYVLIVPLSFAVLSAGALRARFKGRSLKPLVAIGVLATVVSVWAASPSYLAYANEAFGGPSHAYKILADSDLDWGQDLGRLADYLLASPYAGRPLWLLYGGTASPAAYDITAHDLSTASPDQVHGLIAAQASLLNYDYYGRYTWLKQLTPVAQVGHSILIYLR